MKGMKLAGRLNERLVKAAKALPQIRVFAGTYSKLILKNKWLVGVLSLAIPLLTCLFLGLAAVSFLERRLGCAPWHESTFSQCAEREDFSPCSHLCTKEEDSRQFDVVLAVTLGLAFSSSALSFWYTRRKRKQLSRALG